MTKSTKQLVYIFLHNVPKGRHHVWSSYPHVKEETMLSLSKTNVVIRLTGRSINEKFPHICQAVKNLFFHETDITEQVDMRSMGNPKANIRHTMTLGSSGQENVRRLHRGRTCDAIENSYRYVSAILTRRTEIGNH